MIKLIIGRKGSGKTKKLVDLVNEATAISLGNVVCIEKERLLTYDVNYRARLLETDHYKVSGYDAFYGFISGIIAGDHDITDILVDATLKIGGRDYEALANFLEKIAERLGWKVDKVCNYLTTLDELHPAAAFFVVLREIAIHLDLKYPDHIKNSPEIYVISLLDGRITKANKAHIRSYKNFAAFRSIEDAKIACNITRDVLKEMFKSGK